MPDLDQEQWCLERLKSAVLDQHPGTAFRDKRERDPPDFWLYVNDRRFAVEITTIRVKDDATFWASRCALIRTIESDAIAAGDLSGRYVVEACGELPRPVRKAKKALADGIREYLRKTRAVRSSPRFELRAYGARLGNVQKCAPGGQCLYLIGGLSDTGASEYETRNELQELVNARLHAKRTKLVDCKHPTILVLYDCYGLQNETAAFVRRIKESPDTSFFDAVFLIHGNGDEVFAHQSNLLVE